MPARYATLRMRIACMSRRKLKSTRMGSMFKKFMCVTVIVATTSSLSACADDVKEPKCSDLKRNDTEMLKKQEAKYPELMRQLRDKCPNQGTGGFVPSTATKGLIR